MATATQIVGNRLSKDSGELIYVVTGATGASDARSAALSAAPTLFNGIFLSDAIAEEQPTGKDDLYRVSVRYGTSSGGGSADAPEGTENDGFEVAINPVRVNVAKQVVSSTLPSSGGKYSTAPDFEGAINVDAEGNVNGIEFPPATPQTLTRTKIVDSALFTETYFRTLASKVAKYNDATFLGFDAGEVLFLGASGTRRSVDSSEPWSITYKFGISLNETNLQVTPKITVPSKKGWDLVWVYSRTVVDDNAKAKISQPQAAYVVRVTESGSFSGLIL